MSDLNHQDKHPFLDFVKNNQKALTATLVIAVVETPFVNTKVVGAVGTVAVNANVLAVAEEPTPFLAFTLIVQGPDTPSNFTVSTLSDAAFPETTETPVGKVHVYEVAKAETPAVNVNAVLVPAYLLIFVIAVVATPSVITKVDETAGIVAVNANVNGREYQDKNTLETKYFLSLNAWKITKK